MVEKIKTYINSDHFHLTKKQFFKFIGVGLINTLLCFIAFAILTDIFSINDKVANVIGYIIGVTNSYILNKFWTFKSKDFQLKEFILFVIIFLFSLGLQLGVYVLMKDHLYFHKYIAFVFGMGAYTLSNFILNKLFTFKK